MPGWGALGEKARRGPCEVSSSKGRSPESEFEPNSISHSVLPIREMGAVITLFILP